MRRGSRATGSASTLRLREGTRGSPVFGSRSTSLLPGEWVRIGEGEERRLRAWDFVHCPPWTEHVFVGTGDGPCLVLAVGARLKGQGIRYPVNEVALRYDA